MNKTFIKLFWLFRQGHKKAIKEIIYSIFHGQIYKHAHKKANLSFVIVVIHIEFF